MSMRSTRNPDCNSAGTCSAQLPPSEASEWVMQTVGAVSGPIRSYAIERPLSGKRMGASELRKYSEQVWRDIDHDQDIEEIADQDENDGRDVDAPEIGQHPA